MQANPITIKSLWENAWVFTFYGILLALIIGIMDVFHIDLSKTESLMMEPLSFYSFSALSIFGLFGLGIVNTFFLPTAQEMHDSAWVRNFWVPIANAGLSTGAIIMGMMLGLGIGLIPWALGDSQIKNFVKLLFAMSIFVLAILVPLTWMKRSMFDLTKEAERISTIIGIIYCLVVSAIFWIIDREKFWCLLVLTILAFIIFFICIKFLSKNRTG